MIPSLGAPVVFQAQQGIEPGTFSSSSSAKLRLLGNFHFVTDESSTRAKPQATQTLGCAIVDLYRILGR
jgi:hypothetical protein